jgi:hypothetical protein
MLRVIVDSLEPGGIGVGVDNNLMANAWTREQPCSVDVGLDNFSVKQGGGRMNDGRRFPD